MRSQFIAVLDSGVGGLSVLKELVQNFPNERFLYLGDKNNFPYGQKSKEQLFNITKSNINFLRKYDIKLLVLACNTLSVNLLNEIEDYSKIKTFGVFPPVQDDCLEKTLLLCTKLTASIYKSNERCDVVALNNLASIIENNFYNLHKIDFIDCIKEDAKGRFVNQKGYYSTVILGCTHYEFIKNQIYDHFQPQKITSGIKNTIFQINKFIKYQKSLVKIKQKQVLFVGESAEIVKKFWVYSGQNSQN